MKDCFHENEAENPSIQHSVCASRSPFFVSLEQRRNWGWSPGWPNLISCLLHTCTHTHTHCHPFISCNRLIGLREPRARGREIASWGGAEVNRKKWLYLWTLRMLEIKVFVIESWCFTVSLLQWWRKGEKKGKGGTEQKNGSERKG